MEPFAISWILEQIGTWFDKLSNRKDRLNEIEQESVTAFLSALSETQIYLGRITGGSAPIARKDEEELARLWQTAAAKVRRIDPVLAQHCLAKSEHWATSREWRENMPESRKAEIAISAMRKHAEKLLGA